MSSPLYATVATGHYASFLMTPCHSSRSSLAALMQCLHQPPFVPSSGNLHFFPFLVHAAFVVSEEYFFPILLCVPASFA